MADQSVPHPSGLKKVGFCLEKLATTHSYEPDSFKLHRLPSPRPGELLGLIGTHKTGKSTALKILGGRLKPNLGRFDDPPDWPEILTHVKDCYFKSYFADVLAKKPRIVFQHQDFTDLRNDRFFVGETLKMYDQRGKLEEVCDALDLNSHLKRNLRSLTPGLLQVVTIAAKALQKGDVYIFDEPSHFLDVAQRLNVARVIRSLLTPDNYVIVADHDLTLVDYVSDAIFCVYGKPEAYGVVTKPYNTRSGIEAYLDGFDLLETQYMRAASPSDFVARKTAPKEFHNEGCPRLQYPDMTSTFKRLKLQVTGAEFKYWQICVVLGESGTGKTTFIRMLTSLYAGLHPPDEVKGVEPWSPPYTVSYKPQLTILKSGCTVRQLLKRLRVDDDVRPGFKTEVLTPLQIDQMMDRDLDTLSPGETPKLDIACCLAKTACLYLIDEPSEYLDAEERIVTSMAIRQHVLNMGKSAVVVERDFMMAAYLADQVILVEPPAITGSATSTSRRPSTITESVTSTSRRPSTITESVTCNSRRPSTVPKSVPTAPDFVTSSPHTRFNGMRIFAEQQNITFRKDRLSFRFLPKVNKLGSTEDEEQKRAGNYLDPKLNWA
ncbi:unnamed protein product [Thlaspi arvense]|uniref:ABC transporter domain-containing protein n=1 Tax=Thlaspi arvense TaxID=13288 RepID=A0AAU9SVN2_THLAR|nr:unnamed protein product [Thlaspi arvense]